MIQNIITTENNYKIQHRPATRIVNASELPAFSFGFDHHRDRSRVAIETHS